MKHASPRKTRAWAILAAFVLGLSTACQRAEREAGVDQIFAALERAPSPYLADSRLQLAAWLQRHADELGRIRDEVEEQAGDADQQTDFEAFDRLHAELAQGILEFKLDEGADWKGDRETLIEKARGLEQRARELVDQASS